MQGIQLASMFMAEVTIALRHLLPLWLPQRGFSSTYQSLQSLVMHFRVESAKNNKRGLHQYLLSQGYEGTDNNLNNLIEGKITQAHNDWRSLPNTKHYACTIKCVGSQHNKDDLLNCTNGCPKDAEEIYNRSKRYNCFDEQQK